MIRLATLCLLLFTASAQAQTWQEITPTTGSTPTARRYAGAVHDPVGGRMIVYGGEAASGRLTDVWAFDLNTELWTELTPGTSPQKRRTPSVVYDPVGHRMLLWAGQDGGTFFDDSWAFDLSQHTWSEFAPPQPIPNRRYGTVSVYDPVAQALVTYAGFTFQGRFDDTWRFDPVAETWTQLTTSTPPLRRCLHSASYDSRDHRLIMYGGQNAGPLDDIWALDLNSGTWTDLTPATRPTGRFFAAHVYDSRTHRAVVFGGTRGNQGGNTDEVWAFDLDATSWELINVMGPGPSAREGSVAIYLEAEDRMIVFGGHDGGYLNDVWSIDGLSNGATPAPTPQTGRLVLSPAQPNPFNPRTELRFELARPGTVQLVLTDLRGRVVRRVVDGYREAGQHREMWDGTDDKGRAVSSGVYLARLVAGNEDAVTKVTLVR